MARWLSQEEMQIRLDGERPPHQRAAESAPPPGAPRVNPNHNPHALAAAGSSTMQHPYAYQGRVPQFPYHASGHYVDPYAAVRETAAALDPPRVIPPRPEPPAQPQREQGAIFDPPPQGWTMPRSFYARQRRQSERARRRDYSDDEDEDEDDDRPRRLRRAQTQRRRSHSRGRAALVMDPTTAASSLTGGYAALSLHGSDTIKIANLQGVAVLSALGGVIDHFWALGHTVRRDGFNVAFKLGGRPWTASSDDGLRAKRVLTRIYTVLATHGYIFVCSTNTAALLSSPVQLFMPDDRSALQATSVYLGLTISASKRKITLIDAPLALAQRVRDLVRNYFPDCGVNLSPPRLAAYATTPVQEPIEDPLLAEGIVVIRLPGILSGIRVPQFGAPRPYETTAQNVLGHLQHLLNTAGFFLCGTLPLDLPVISLRRRDLNLYRSMGRYWGGY